MKKRRYRRQVFGWFTVLAVAVFSVISIQSCKNPNRLENFLPDTADGQTRLVVGFHDALQMNRSASQNNIEALLLTDSQ